ncbi:class I SAM-dependent methyltransferase [Chondromyces crocatus]|uniref:Methyltransferase type 11 domain-containing protein n=1 Tax=Chondromyces crocatus TaxID=52 RepID=A0A0K1EF37_CHOCO|nr:class I SAM-dependent methyltransferase [Chondromyces crocatus]AKT39481.1 uncharacterized protein CMC5_036280 [Chondromyces crocatus]
MRKLLAAFLPVMFVTSLGCGGELPPPEAPPPPPPPATPEPVAEPIAEPPAPIDPAEKKKQDERAKLAADMAAMEDKAKAEAARFDDALKAQVKALTEAKYANAKAGLTAAMKSGHRVPGNADRDVYRHPVETLTFFGLTPTQTVIEFGGGGGWYTELLAPVLASKGKLRVTSMDWEGPEDVRSTLYGRRFKRFLEKSTELTGKIEPVVLKDLNAPELGPEGSADLVIAIREMHGWVNNKRVEKNLAAVHKVLKKGGVFGVVAHRGKEGADVTESSKKGYLPEAWVIQTVEAAGFKLAGKSEVNANPKDTKDYPEGVWALLPTLERGEKDRDTLSAIGESDRMTLKFTKR